MFIFIENKLYLDEPDIRGFNKRCMLHLTSYVEKDERRVMADF